MPPTAVVALKLDQPSFYCHALYVPNMITLLNIKAEEPELERPSVTPYFERFLDGILPDLAFLAEYSEEPDLFAMLGNRLVGLAQQASAAKLEDKEDFIEEFRAIEYDDYLRPFADSILESMYRLMTQTGEHELVQKSTECLMKILHYASLPTSCTNQRLAAVNILSTFRDAEQAWQLKLNSASRNRAAH